MKFSEERVALLIDGNNLERSLHSEKQDSRWMISYDNLLPEIMGERALYNFTYFREGKRISDKLESRLKERFKGTVEVCEKSADVPLVITAIKLAPKVDTIIIGSGDSDFVPLAIYLTHLRVSVEIIAHKATLSSKLADTADKVHLLEKNHYFRL